MSRIGLSRRNVLEVAGGLAALLGSASLIGVVGADDEEQGADEGDAEEAEEEEEEEEEEATVEFTDQTVEADGTPTVYVEEVKVPSGGWIVVHNWGTDGVNDDDDPTGNFIGVSAYLEAGEYERLPVELGGDVPASVPSGEGYTVSAMAHRDDPSNRTFDFPNEVDDGEKPDDPPYTDDDGNIVQSFADVNFE